METFTINRKTIIVIVAAIAMFLTIGVGLLNNRINFLKDKVESEVVLRTALLDSIHTYKNKYNEVVAEKKTIQATNSQLKSLNGSLTANQKELIARVKQQDKNFTVIASALVKTKISLDSLLNGNGIVNDSAKTIEFPYNSSDLNYLILIKNVKATVSKPILLIKSLELLNKQEITFKWTKEKNNPVAFSITNSNTYFKAYDIDSYIIPEIKKSEIKPNFFQRLENSLNTGTKFGIGVGLGAGITYLLIH